MTDLSKSWDLEIDPSILKTLRRIPQRDVENVLEVIHLLPADPYFGDIQKMKGEENTWRRRVGSYRIFFKIKVSERIILVFGIDRRTSKNLLISMRDFASYSQSPRLVFELWRDNMNDYGQV